MTKHLFEEKTGLRIGLIKYKSLLLFLLLFDFIFPQIPFKGFCKINSFKADSGYTNIFSFNYNGDEYSDLLLYNPSNKKALLYDGKPGIEFHKKKEINFPLEISKIEPIILSNNMIETFAFTSRKSRSFGILKFSAQGNPEVVSKIKFNSYPSNFSIADLNSDSNYVYLISGNSFDGLSIITQKNQRLEENKIDNKRSYKNAVFIDFNSDNFQDIVALNTAENKLHFFFNNTHGGLKELRTIDINENIKSMKVFDINYDGFKDIIISTSLSVIIYFGDASASYNNVLNVKTQLSADEFVIGDFNRDGFFDINYVNKNEGIIATIFAKDFYSFYPEFIHKKDVGVIDIIPFFSKFVYGTAYLNKNCEVNILSQIISMSEEQYLAVGIEPDLIVLFDNANNGINDIAFTDNYDNKLKFILLDAAGLPEKFFDVDIYDTHTSIIGFDNSKTVKTFFLYSDGKRIIESIKIDFDKFSIKREHHYAEGNIKDLIVRKDANDNPEILILYEKNKNLNLQVLHKTPLKYSQTLYQNISSDWLSSFIIPSAELSIGYWQLKKDLINLNIVSVEDMSYQIGAKIKMEYGLVVSKSNSENINSNFDFAGLISGDETIYLIKGNEKVSVFSRKSSKDKFRITDKNQLFFGKNNSVFVYDKKLKNIYELVTSKFGKKLNVKKAFSDIELNKFSIPKFDLRNNYLLFANIKTGFIGIRQQLK